MTKLKTSLAIIVVCTFTWLCFFGNLLQQTPSTLTVVVFVICAGSFGTLVFLRAFSFMIWLKERLFG
ncbi:hypothetical protein PH7735_00527 [Shimia thalassica]|uniref:Uncharacterized protein n=1 Tax=Shimia thalassica TaxID=1715693 RepID=A0A0P1I1U8_9RHOB|nr:hypothetical protein PH7735_00527 [Shimia thalassica]